MAIFRIELYLLSVATLVSGSTYAAAIPDAGTLLQQIEQNQQPNIPHKDLPEKLPEPATPGEQKGVIITVKSFRFAGNTLLSSDQLASVVKDYLNRPLDFTQLQEAVAAVAKVYRDAGWIVRAYLPRQDITNGTVTIQIVEAVFGGARLEGQPASRVKLDKILSVINAQQKQGALLNADAIDRGLLLADDLPGVAVAGSLHEGEKAKETDLLLRLTDEPLLYGDAGTDNTGPRATGANRVTANVNFNSPLKMGDLSGANFMHTQGSDYIRLDESFPVGVNGWRAGINGSYLKYNLVVPEFAALNAHGTSNTLGLEATYPLIRSRMKNVYFSANLDDKNYDNFASGANTSKYRTNTATVGLSGNLFDSVGGGGANSASMTLIDGLLDLNNSPNQAADAAAAQTAGRFDKLRYSATRQQVITEDWSFFSALSGQRANKNLDSSEMFYLSGASGVRAYPANEGGGADGDELNLELRRKLPRGFTVTGFYDYGQITINRDNNFARASALNEYSLKGIGLSLGWLAESGLTIKATYSRRIGDNPNPTLTGTDQDGSFVRDRLWLVVNMPFSFNGSSNAASSSDLIPLSTIALSSAEAGNAATTTLPVAKDLEKALADNKPEVKTEITKFEEASPAQSSKMTVPAVAPVTTPAIAPIVAASTGIALAAKDNTAKNDTETAPKQAVNTQPKPQPAIETEYFGPMSTQMLKGSAARLASVVKYAKEHPDDLIEVDGYTDTHAEVAHTETQTQVSVKVSQQRAEAVKNYLVNLGINVNRIATQGFGNQNPVATNASKEGRAKNRRVEIRFEAKVKTLAEETKSETTQPVLASHINVPAVAVVVTPANAPTVTTVSASTGAAVAAKDDRAKNTTVANNAANNPAGNVQPPIETEYFGPMSSLMLKGSAARLAPVVKYANAHPDDTIELDGYSDTHAEVAHSETQHQNSVKVSLQRAEAVKGFLEKLGINANRITTQGFGNQNPVSSNVSKEGRAKNRRVEIRFIDKK
jgi:hemolysin activation/secretion protein/outer membrane protein OmpA-like peptidoglycan-associated protein